MTSNAFGGAGQGGYALTDPDATEPTVPLSPTEPLPTTTAYLGSGPDPRAAGEDGAAGRDRWWVHLIWDGILLVLALVGLAALVLFTGGDLLFDRLLVDRLYLGVPFLLLATALALSIRVRAVNLAVGAVAAVSAALFLEWEGRGPLIAGGMVLLAAVVTGLVLAGLVSGLRLPGWAVSLAATLPLTVVAGAVFSQQLGLTRVFPVSAWLTDPGTADVTLSRGGAGLLVLVAIAGSVAGGALGLLPPVRRLLHRCRQAAAGTSPRTLATSLATGAALLVSCLLAAAAGVLLTIPPDSGLLFRTDASLLEPLGLALPLAIVLLGGTSLWGARGGVAGTFLAALLLFVVVIALMESGAAVAPFWIPLAAMAIGLVVSWLGELLGRAPARRPSS